MAGRYILGAKNAGLGSVWITRLRAAVGGQPGARGYDPAEAVIQALDDCRITGKLDLKLWRGKKAAQSGACDFASPIH